MRAQLTDTVVMVRPDTFGFNPQTAATNEFQHKPTMSENKLRASALEEFNSMVLTLKKHGVHVLVFPSPSKHIVPDAVFPNNWFSFHEGGVLVVYPMLAPNRRLERQPEVFKKAIQVNRTIDLTSSENDGMYLEGTGSLVLDREHKVAFAVSSPRTNEILVRKWGKRMGYETIFFHAAGLVDRMPIYHTNVLMNIGNGFCVICLAAIGDTKERQMVENKIHALGLTCVDLTFKQLHAFCGNMLSVKNAEGKVKIILSDTAHRALTVSQRTQLSMFGELIPVAIPTIEQIGGGSARCMLGEVF